MKAEMKLKKGMLKTEKEGRIDGISSSRPKKCITDGPTDGLTEGPTEGLKDGYTCFAATKTEEEDEERGEDAEEREVEMGKMVNK